MTCKRSVNCDGYNVIPIGMMTKPQKQDMDTGQRGYMYSFDFTSVIYIYTVYIHIYIHT